jgi:hypothetical protein
VAAGKRHRLLPKVPRLLLGNDLGRLSCRCNSGRAKFDCFPIAVCRFLEFLRGPERDEQVQSPKESA